MIEIIQILLLSSAFLPGLFLRVSSSVPASQFEKLVSIHNFCCTLEYHMWLSTVLGNTPKLPCFVTLLKKKSYLE